MDYICQMNCHNCTLQDSVQSKNACAMLLMPAILNKINTSLSEVIEQLKTVQSTDEQIIKEIKLVTKTKIEEDD